MKVKEREGEQQITSNSSGANDSQVCGIPRSFFFFSSSSPFVPFLSFPPSPSSNEEMCFIISSFLSFSLSSLSGPPLNQKKEVAHTHTHTHTHTQGRSPGPRPISFDNQHLANELGIFFCLKTSDGSPQWDDENNRVSDFHSFSLSVCVCVCVCVSEFFVVFFLYFASRVEFYFHRSPRLVL